MKKLGVIYHRTIPSILHVSFEMSEPVSGNLKLCKTRVIFFLKI